MQQAASPAGTLTQYLRATAVVARDRTALLETNGTALTYAELASLADRTARWLRAAGLEPGDRVAVHLPKCIDAVAAQWGILCAGAAYVPVDAEAPMARSAYIMADCAVRVVITEERAATALREALREHGVAPVVLALEAPGGGRALSVAVADVDGGAEPGPAGPGPGPEDVAYILYTSGSTGRPKGVTLTHRNATAFVEWCSAELQPSTADRFSSHAPLHFDLSILDLYLPAKHGAATVLIGSAEGKEPTGLAAQIASHRITIWYSTPSILTMLGLYGRLARHDYGALRLVLFAGEVFPVKHLRALKAQWPAARYCNLYGPTETNVCTWHWIPEAIPADREEPFPIGRTCPHLRGRVITEEGREVPAGEAGELLIAGDNVMREYWNLPERTAAAFLTDVDGIRWYRTGDVVADTGAGVLAYLGRRDRMVKRRGYRIELGEVEAALYTHPAVAEMAALAGRDRDGGTRITAFVVLRDGEATSTLEWKRFAVGVLPAYMVPDRFVVLAALPRTSTDKTDMQALQERA